MNEGKERALWWHTSAVVASIANANRDRKKRSKPYRADEIHPWEVRDRKKKSVKKKASIRILKSVFVDKTFEGL